MRKNKGWRADETVILFASQPVPEINPFSGLTGDLQLPRRVEARLRDFVAQHQGFRLLVRYHPSEQGVTFQQGQSRVEQSRAEEDWPVVLNAVDIAVTFVDSLAAWEASLAGRPVIALRKYETIESPDTVMDWATVLSWPDAIEQVLLAWRANKPQPVQVDMAVGNSATEKIIAVIDSLLESADNK